MVKKKGTVVYLSEEDKNNLEAIANHWGISQSSAVQRLIREYINTTATKVARAASLSALK
jgi:predicted DNA-binding protein